MLADEARLTLVIAGRSRAKAEAFCAGLQAAATLVPAAFDRDGDVERQLKAIAPDTMVDVTGPFQAYGDDPYRVVKAALALGVNYLDLSDGADFVKGIAQFDDAARARGVFVLSGVSSFPVLTAAVVRALAEGMRGVDSVTGGIAPSPYANVGLNVIRAIASYAGKPVALRRDGRPAVGYGLVDTRRYTIAPPGRLPLYPIRFSLVDVPDLQLLPDLWPGLRSVWMGAGPVPEIWHRLLNACAWLVRLRVLPSLSPFAGLMYRTINTLSWGEHRGGMFVAVAGEGRTDKGSSGPGISWPKGKTAPSFPRWRPRPLSAIASSAGCRRQGRGRRRVNSKSPTMRRCLRSAGSPPAAGNRWPRVTARRSTGACWVMPGAGCPGRCAPCMTWMPN